MVGFSWKGSKAGGAMELSLEFPWWDPLNTDIVDSFGLIALEFPWVPLMALRWNVGKATIWWHGDNSGTTT
jgi:hypothetical protein